MKFISRNLWIKVLVLLAIFSLTVVSISGYLSSVIFKSNWEKEARRSYSLFLHYMANDVFRIVQHYREILELSAEVIEQNLSNNWKIETFLVSVCLKYPSFEWIRYISKEGKVLVSSEMSLEQKNFVGDMNAERVISDVLYDSRGEPYLTITLPCGEGYLCGRINLSSIWVDIKELLFIPDGKLLILDSHNKTVFSTDYRMLFRRKASFIKSSVVSFEEQIPQLNWKMFLTIELPDFYRDIMKSSLWLWLMTFVLFLLAFWVSVEISRSWFKPLEKIVPFIEQVSKGNLDVYLDIDRDDEIGLLVFQVNKMVANLKELKRQSNIQVVGRTISWLGHEIKNYFVPIRAFIDSLAKGNNDATYIRKMSQLIAREMENCEKMLHDLTALRPDLTMEFERVNVCDLVSAVLEMLDPLLQMKKIAVSVEVEPELFCWADKEKLKTALLNLLLNSIEAVPEKGRILIKSFEKGDRFRLQVIDTGPGIPADIVDRIFDPFVSSKDLNSSKNRRKQKRGLGLAIVYNIIKKHNGTIRFITGPKGTTFIICLPKFT